MKEFNLTYLQLIICVLFDIVTSFNYKFDVIPSGGRLVDPPGRSSLWRENFTNVPINVLDHRQNCGGREVLWKENKGRCGVCGDPWSGPKHHEYGGKYFSGNISRIYKKNSTALVTVLTSSDLYGWFEFRIFPILNISDKISRENLNNYLLNIAYVNSTTYNVFNSGYHVIPLLLPDHLTCDQCLLQWKFQIDKRYACGSKHVDTCNTNSSEEQEQFYGCADVTILDTVQLKSRGRTISLNRQLQSFKNETPESFRKWWCTSQCIGQECLSTICDVTQWRHHRQKRAGINCRPTVLWSKYPSMYNWCVVNCAYGYCPAAYCECDEEKSTSTEIVLSTTTTSTTTVSTSLPTESSSTPVESTTVTTTTTTESTTTKEYTTTPQTSTASTSQSYSQSTPLASTSLSSTTQQVETTTPSNDTPELVQYLSTAVCAYCNSTADLDTFCRSTFCKGYATKELNFNGDMENRFKELSTMFCDFCGSDEACKHLFCPGGYYIVAIAIAKRCELCRNSNDSVCLQDPACSSMHTSTTADTRADASITKSSFLISLISSPSSSPTTPTSTAGTSTASSTPSPGTSTQYTASGQKNCSGAGIYDGNAAMKEWCDLNCNHNPPECPDSYCTCEEVEDLTIDVLNTANKLNCYEHPRWSHYALMKTWCKTNCPLYCPPSYCICDIVTTAATSTAMFTSSTTTQSSSNTSSQHPSTTTPSYQTSTSTGQPTTSTQRTTTLLSTTLPPSSTSIPDTITTTRGSTDITTTSIDQGNNTSTYFSPEEITRNIMCGICKNNVQGHTFARCVQEFCSDIDTRINGKRSNSEKSTIEEFPLAVQCSLDTGSSDNGTIYCQTDNYYKRDVESYIGDALCQSCVSISGGSQCQTKYC